MAVFCTSSVYYCDECVLLFGTCCIKPTRNSVLILCGLMQQVPEENRKTSIIENCDEFFVQFDHSAADGKTHMAKRSSQYFTTESKHRKMSHRYEMHPAILRTMNIRAECTSFRTFAQTLDRANNTIRKLCGCICGAISMAFCLTADSTRGMFTIRYVV